MTPIERLFALILFLPIAGLVDDAYGRYSGINWINGVDRLITEPALLESILLSVWVALASLLISLFVARAVTQKVTNTHDSPLWRGLLLAMPHSALALGLLLALSAGGVGWRWLAPILDLPVHVQYLFPRDKWGLGAILSLGIKESAFLTATAVIIAKRLPLQSYRVIAAQAGLTPSECHHQLIWPQILRSLWPAVFVVFVFSLTNLEVSLILAPDQPQLIGVRLFRLLIDPDPLNRQAGSIGLIILLLVLGLIWLVFQILNRSRVSDKRWSLPGINLVARLFTISFSGLIFMAVVSLLIWSVTLRWDVLESLPIVSIHALTSIFSLLSPLVTTLVIGFSTSVIAVFIAVGILEYSVSRGHNRLHWIWWAYLWMPALPLASGLLAWVYFLGGSPGVWPVILGHTLIALPYVMIIVSEPWFDRDIRHEMILKQSSMSVCLRLFRVWVPRHSRLLVLAGALAFAVSCALYTQTVLLGGGRVETLMTELIVTVGSDRRSSAVAGLINLLLPFVAFTLALLINQSLWKHRAGMQGEGYADSR